MTYPQSLITYYGARLVGNAVYKDGWVGEYPHLSSGGRWYIDENYYDGTNQTYQLHSSDSFDPGTTYSVASTEITPRAGTLGSYTSRPFRQYGDSLYAFTDYYVGAGSGTYSSAGYVYEKFDMYDGSSEGGYTVEYQESTADYGTYGETGYVNSLDASGNFWAVKRSAGEKIMGAGPYNRVDYVKRTSGGTWSQVSLDDGGEVNYSAGSYGGALAANNDVIFYYYDQGSLSIVYKVLPSGGSLSSKSSISANQPMNGHYYFEHDGYYWNILIDKQSKVFVFRNTSFQTSSFVSGSAEASPGKPFGFEWDSTNEKLLCYWAASTNSGNDSVYLYSLAYNTSTDTFASSWSQDSTGGYLTGHSSGSELQRSCGCRRKNSTTFYALFSDGSPIYGTEFSFDNAVTTNHSLDVSLTLGSLADTLTISSFTGKKSPLGDNPNQEYIHYKSSDNSYWFLAEGPLIDGYTRISVWTASGDDRWDPYKWQLSGPLGATSSSTNYGFDGIARYFDGRYIYALLEVGSAGWTGDCRVRYCCFDTQTETWETTSEDLYVGGDAAGFLDICARDPDSVWASYIVTAGNYLRYKSSSGWESAQSQNTTTTNPIHLVRGGSNRIHFLSSFTESGGVEGDPHSLWYRTSTSGNSLSSWGEYSPSTYPMYGDGTYQPWGYRAFWAVDESGTLKIKAMGSDGQLFTSGPNYMYQIEATDADSLSWGSETQLFQTTYGEYGWYYGQNVIWNPQSTDQWFIWTDRNLTDGEWSSSVRHRHIAQPSNSFAVRKMYALGSGQFNESGNRVTSFDGNPFIHLDYSTAVGSSITYPTSLMDNDWLVVCAFNESSSTVPSMPSSWDSVTSWSYSSVAMRLARLPIDSSGATTYSGDTEVWTNATRIICVRIRNGEIVDEANGVSIANGNSSTLNYAARSVETFVAQSQKADDCIIAFGAHSVSPTFGEPDGLVRICDAGKQLSAFWSSVPRDSDWPSTNVSVESSGLWQTVVARIAPLAYGKSYSSELANIYRSGRSYIAGFGYRLSSLNSITHKYWSYFEYDPLSGHGLQHGLTALSALSGTKTHDIDISCDDNSSTITIEHYLDVSIKLRTTTNHALDIITSAGKTVEHSVDFILVGITDVVVDADHDPDITTNQPASVAAPNATGDEKKLKEYRKTLRQIARD